MLESRAHAHQGRHMIASTLLVFEHCIPEAYVYRKLHKPWTPDPKYRLVAYAIKRRARTVWTTLIE